MADRSNKLKSENAPAEANRPKKAVKEGKNSVKRKFNLVPNEKFVKVTGLFLLLFSLFLAASFISHLFHWRQDFNIVKDASFGEFVMDKSLRVQNSMGKSGAYLAYVFFNNWFGLASFLIPFCLFIVAFRMFFNVTLLPLKRTLGYSLFALIYVSLSCALILSEKYQMLSGGFGITLYNYISGMAGTAGVTLLLLFSGISFLMLALNMSFELPGRKTKAEPAAEEPESPFHNTFRDSAINGGRLSSDGEYGGNLNDEEEIEDEVEDIEEDEEVSPEELEIEGPFERETESSIIEDLPIPAPVAKPAAPVLELTISEPDPEPEPKSASAPSELLQVENPELLTEEEKERMNLKEVLGETEEFEMEDYDPLLDLSSYKFPEPDLLENHGGAKVKVEKAELEANSNRIIETLKNYNIDIARISASIGPTVTLYEIVPAAGVRISRIKNLEDDIALSLSALGIRIIAPMPGKGTIGIEVPNQHPEVVAMKTLITSDKFVNAGMDLPVALGKTISNENFVADLAKMPHLLMAGATGQGKSVGLNAILVSLLYKKHPAQIKFVLVDPKKVELTLFNKIERHFLAKLPGNEDAIITDTKKVVHTLNSLCKLMDERYELLKSAMVRNIKEYNQKFISRKLNPKNGHHYMPYIVLVVDEFADLIMTAGKEVELPIARLAQLARAIGIHLIIATQRPSVNIITGTIKANFPARIAFRVTSKIDSRTILDAGGAEQLIGRGDMLFSTGSDLIRLQCPFVDTPEVEKITEFIGSQRGYPSAYELPEYVDENADMGGEEFDAGDRDSMFEEAAEIVVMHQQASASILQRKLKLGYNRAGRIVDQLEKAGIIGPFEGSKARKVLVKDAMSLEQILRPGEN